jgi:transcriptional regulator with GAF, ATPase, and Fis domain
VARRSGRETSDARPEIATVAHARGGRGAPPLGAVIRVIGAEATPPSFCLGAGTCVVGSAAPADIVIAEPTVSRKHAELKLVPEGIALKDLGSRNGTFYLGQRVEKMVLGLGARVEVGAATLALEADTRALGDAPSWEGSSYRGIVGASPAMKRLFATLARLEGSLVTVLVEGESGVGKEVISRALHEGSPIAGGPLVIVNCGAVAKELVASELFGHRRGAFTGAVDARRGAFEAADGGTLFLDEIGELPLETQPMLLRALESGEIRAVGDDTARRVQVRVIAATNRDLANEVGEGSFREDLFYRLAVVRLRVPPLRERVEDIEPLARHFAATIGLGELPQDVLESLKCRSWPGNARELKNAIQAYSILGSLPESLRAKTVLLEVALRELVDLERPYAAQKDDFGDRFTRVYLTVLMARADGNQTTAARIAGLDRSYLGRMLAKHGLGRAS